MIEQNLHDLSIKTTDYYSSSREEMLQFIPQTVQRVLEIGCGEGGFLLNVKKRFNAEVWGIEYNEEASNEAKKHSDNVLTGDVSVLVKVLPLNYFDCIIFNDVIEHLADPYSILRDLKKNLSSEGVIVASIPNVRHISVLKELIFDKDWNYVDAGILDKTHLRFFTKKSIIKMFEFLGYDLLKIKGINGMSSFKKFHLWNILSLGHLSDAQYSQYACVAKPKKD